jgi:exodeoxyribonuclease V gamma subunit
MLHIHRAERADALVGALRDVLAVPLEDPFAPEVVSVPTRGMERWLTQRLSGALGASPGRGDGVCANVEFPPPRRLLGEAVAVASGIAADADPWLPERAVWPLLEVAAGFPAIAPHLEGGRRFAALRHLAGLYDHYALQRPEMVRAWAAGEQAHWQAGLWRGLRARLGVPSPAERLPEACARLRAEPALAGLPPRLAIFGLTRLPGAHLEVLDALAHAREVHLFVLHPSPALWERLRGARAVRRAEDATAPDVENPLLASWGRDARELQLLLAGRGEDRHHPVEAGEATLLQRLQRTVREDRRPEPLKLAEGDRSVQVHACHGRARQVEVVRDAILHALAEDPALEPRDVIVMCPDIEAFAPLIQATFGEGEVGDLRVRLADRALRQTNPVLGVVAELLELAGQRVTASQVLDLADRGPVRGRFRLDDDDLARAQDWIAAAGIRWGLDAEHRAPFKLAALPTGTWRFGLDRLLLGVTMTEEDQRLFAEVLPLDDVESGAIDLAGRLAELVDRLTTALDNLARTQPIAAWAAALAAAADALTATAPRDAWQRAELQRLLDDAVAEAAGSEEPLAPAELKALLGERLQGRPTRANFRTGHLTICTLVPMRSVPHRVVCLLGLDDGAFPRKAPRDGDDLLLADPHVGDRDPRSEDRQMLLDALLAATDRLIVTYTGNDERTNAPRPPAVPVGELLDLIDGDVVRRHPLQPFDPRNFEAHAPWRFDATTLAGARALSGPRRDPPPFLTAPLPPVRRDVVELDDLVRFVSHPVRAFLRQRLGVSVGDYDDEVEDALHVELDGLGKWGVGERLLQARLAGVERRTAILAERSRGQLPPGALGFPVIEQIEPVVEGIYSEAQARAGGAPAESLDVRVTLPDGRTLNGTVAGVHGDLLREATYSRINARHRLTAWVRLLALSAAHPERAFKAVTVGRGEGGADVAWLGRVEDPLAALAVLLDLHDRGLREPLPLACRTSAAYARFRADPVGAARREWLSGWDFAREDREREHAIAFGGVLTLEQLLAEPPRADERWDPLEESRFGQYARRLWDDLLAHEGPA